MSEKFIPNKLALITLLAASSVILISMGLRQTFGLFFSAFEEGLNCTRTEFGLAIGLQMLFWGIFAPIFANKPPKFCFNLLNSVANLSPAAAGDVAALAALAAVLSVGVGKKAAFPPNRLN